MRTWLRIWNLFEVDTVRRLLDTVCEISGKTYVCEENPMGIREFSLEFYPDGTGAFCYVNAQGEKKLPFGMSKNVFGKFPQAGYSDLHVGVTGPEGYYYDCAASAAWVEPKKLNLRVQIIDKYFGNLAMVFGFRDEKTVSVRMTRKAEAFLHRYEGIANATAQ